MTATTFPSTSDSQAAARRFTWPTAIALHLLPAAAAFTATLTLAPWLTRTGLPPTFALTVAFAVVLTPVELGLLLLAARRASGGWRVGAALSFRGRLGRRAFLIPALLVPAVILAAAYGPIADALGARLAGIYPAWLLPDYDAAQAGYPRAVLVVTGLVTLLIDGIVNPTVEELYFRAYLLPRLPVRGALAVVTSAVLFTVQHYWQPQNWPLILTLELVLTTAVVLTRRYRLGIALHTAANSLGILVGLAGLFLT
jgi:membrane protease YdiL (CAAX protease family)